MLLLVGQAACFCLTPASTIVAARQRCSVSSVSSKRGSALAAAQGFGKKPEKAAPKPKTASALEREKAAAAYDELSASGVPEHNIFVRVKVRCD